MLDWPYTSHPTGWYQVDWSAELAPGAVKPMRIFDRDVVLYRTEQGAAHLVDAHCPHMGAHLGHGGCIDGDRLVCPWHGWEFAPDGSNVAIPFIDRVNTRVGLAHWPVREVGGIVVVWFDRLGRDPQFEWPGVAEFSDEGFWHPVPHSYKAFGQRRVLPQSPLENAADSQHLPFVHGAGSPARHVAWEEDGPYLRTVFAITFGGGRESTWLTPNGPTESYIESEFWGLGLGVARFVIDDLIVPQLVAVTPVDHESSLLFSSVAGNKQPEHPDGPGGRVLRMMSEQHDQIANDFAIWENQRYVTRPAYSGQEERWFPPIRRWAAQFYPEDTATTTFTDTEGTAAPDIGHTPRLTTPPPTTPADASAG